MVLGIIACAGEFPRMVIQGARRAGVRVVAAGVRGAVGKEIPGMVDAYKSFRVGAIEPAGPVVKTLCSQCRGHGFIPWLGS